MAKDNAPPLELPSPHAGEVPAQPEQESEDADVHTALREKVRQANAESRTQATFMSGGRR